MSNKKSKIRILFALALVVLLTAGITLGAAYASEVTSGECGKGVTWSYADGVLTVSGNGMMKDYRENTMPWYHLKDQITKVVIEDGVTHVGELSFYGFSKISKVELPETLVSIGRYAFYSCGKLKSITIPENVNSIGIYAFRKTSLKTANIAEDGWTAGGNELSGLGDPAEAAKMFTYSTEGYGLYKLSWKRTVVLENTVLESGSCGKKVTWTVYSNGLLEIAGEGKMKEYGAYDAPWEAYKNIITTVVIGDGVTTVGGCSFYGCFALSSVTLPESITAIGRYAFYECKALSAVTVPKAVESIGTYAFRKCKSKGTLTLGNPYGWTVDGEDMDGEMLKNAEYII